MDSNIFSSEAVRRRNRGSRGNVFQIIVQHGSGWHQSLVRNRIKKNEIDFKRQHHRSKSLVPAVRK